MQTCTGSTFPLLIWSMHVRTVEQILASNTVGVETHKVLQSVMDVHTDLYALPISWREMCVCVGGGGGGGGIERIEAERGLIDKISAFHAGCRGFDSHCAAHVRPIFPMQH